jgi:hypothetical protein
MKSVLFAAALALSASAFAADASKAVAMTDAQMAKTVAGNPGNLLIFNTNAGTLSANAVQSSNSRASVNEVSRNGVVTCIRACGS